MKNPDGLGTVVQPQGNESRLSQKKETQEAQSYKYIAYPIPAIETITIDGINNSDILQVTITDIYGKKVAVIELSSGNNTLNISKISSGMYLLYIEKNGTFIQSEKIIIQHP